ncbi:MAG: type II secretion system F family protein [Acidithiobacillus caldus]|nr:type II secretion system F family protein [Acidithiobacillus caldus]
MGLFSGSAEEETGNTAFSLWFAKRLFTLDERINFFERLAELLEANFSITDAVATYYRGYRAKLDGSDSRVVFLRDILEKTGEGYGFAEAVADWVSPTERILIEVGAQSGHLAEALRSCGQVAKNSKEIKTSMRVQLIDPSINALIFIGTAIYTAEDILPIFVKMSNPDSWGGFLYWWYAVSEFFARDLVFLASGFALYVAFAWWSLPRLQDGTFRRILERFPPWNVYKRLQGALFVDAMAAMLRGNMTPRQAIQKIQGQATPYLQSKLEQALDKLVGNERLTDERAAAIFDIDLLPNESVVEIGIYAKGKEFVQNLQKLANYNTQATLAWVSSRIGTVALLVDLSAVLYTSLSIVAMMDLSSSLSH